ncbi:Sorting nexin mvp1 [Pyricularia grisea]|uniref:Sorting nexin MVP1 n=1 Tax=Pyricularia grisea TaxID=148305 RepID=A0A6P8BFV6_PYRGI|nr:uncharacterized protein PgNI_01168 [Pyricularia grisea]KAI6353084.1 Sorting nexin mvp1 [Pyricularia grisea]TLD15504.1 hypothetical protein PgNI_01168 [Pyricularia grisea]
MSLFGSSPPKEETLPRNDSFARSRHNLFDGDTNQSSASLFDDDDDLTGTGGTSSPWDMPTPRKQQSRADLLRNLLSGADVPDSYVDVFDSVLREEEDSSGQIGPKGLMRTLSAAKLSADQSSRIMSIVSPGGGEPELGRSEFNVFLALIGLAQEKEALSLDGVDERRRNLPKPKLPGLLNSGAGLPGVSELAAKSPQRPITPPPKPDQQNNRQAESTPTPAPRTVQKAPAPPPMDYPDDPWGAPELHRNHDHARLNPQSPANGLNYNHQNQQQNEQQAGATNGAYQAAEVASPAAGRTTSTFTTASATSQNSEPSSRPGHVSHNSMSGNNTESAAVVAEGGWNTGYFGDNNSSAAYSDPSAASTHPTSPFGGNPLPVPGHGRVASRTLGPSNGQPGSTIEENVQVVLMPEKEGMFMFQHHNYEVTSPRRGSKVIRRYSDFVWLLDCLHKVYPFRVLPLLPPKRVAVNGNHLSNDGAFIEKRRRGLNRFLNALMRHPVLAKEQLVVMFLTVPTELSVWRKQATISIQDEFVGRNLPDGLEDSLPPQQLEELFLRTRSGVKRSAELYIQICIVMDRLVKRVEGVAADHGRVAMSLQSLSEVSADTYATDNDEVPRLNDGLLTMGKHLRTAQALMEDESKGWDAGVLEDLKRQRDALVAMRDMFDRKERLDRDNIPQLERRIQNNEAKLSNLRAKQEGLVKPGEIEKVVESIIKDKESIVNQHNRHIFVRECVRDELSYFQATQYHITRWNQDWAQERVKYSEMLADNWRRLLDSLDGMPTGE